MIAESLVFSLFVEHGGHRLHNGHGRDNSRPWCWSGILSGLTAGHHAAVSNAGLVVTTGYAAAATAASSHRWRLRLLKQAPGQALVVLLARLPEGLGKPAHGSCSNTFSQCFAFALVEP